MASLREVASDTAEALIARLTHRAPDPAHVRNAIDFGLRARGLEQS